MIYIFKDTEDKKIGKCIAESITEAKAYAKEHKINWCTINILEDKQPIIINEPITPTVNETLTVQNPPEDTTTLEHLERYQNLITELKDTIVETEFSSRWALIEGRHLVGQRLLQEEKWFTDSGYMKMSLHVATSLGISQRQIEQCIQFARKYPDLSLMNTGKNISWHKITQELLPEHVESISKPVTKAELIQILKDIKTLLQHEWETYNQEIING